MIETSTTVAPDVKRLQAMIDEAVTLSEPWKREAWADCEMYDGAQWTESDLQLAAEAGVDPITVNRTFPVVNMLLGAQILNQHEVTPKGRTPKDAELAEVLGQCVAFVRDQSNGQHLITRAFKDAVVAGVGYLMVDFDSDPTREPIRWTHVPWTEIEVDPYGDPWLDPNRCRYVIHRRWVDLDDLIAAFPDRKREIQEQYDIHSQTDHSFFSPRGGFDYGNVAEEQKRTNPRLFWTESGRNRVRPAQVWHTVWGKGLFLRMSNGSVRELPEEMEHSLKYQLVKQSVGIEVHPIRRVMQSMLLGDLMLEQIESPFPHNRFPVVPFISYLDRFNYPFGVPRQIRGQNKEVNLRRSMGLALLRSRRVIVEESVVDDDAALAHLYEEANRLNGMLVVKPGQIGAIQIQEHTDLAPAQMEVMRQSEMEIQEIAGANMQTGLLSGSPDSREAVNQRANNAGAATASLFDNYRLALKSLGEITISMIQGAWSGEKVLRVTDKLTSIDRFVAINQPVTQPDGTVIIKNSVAEGRYDIVVSQSPVTDTVREKHMEQLIEWTKKAPPEMVPQLMMLALELANLPNKEAVLARLKPLMGQDPMEEELTPEELKAKRQQDYQAQQEAKAKQLRMEEARVAAETEEINAKIQDLMASAEEKKAKAKAHASRIELEGVKVGADIELRKQEGRKDDRAAVSGVQKKGGK